MNFVHAREYLEAGDVVIVNCSYQCNVLLTSDSNFNAYRSGGRFSYYGGHRRVLPTRIAAPSTGYWNVTIDLGGASGSFRYNISYLKQNS
jgi:hypothetical protein